LPPGPFGRLKIKKSVHWVADPHHSPGDKQRGTGEPWGQARWLGDAGCGHRMHGGRAVKSAEIQREIILALSRTPRGLDHFQIAASIGQAAVRIRAELKALEREQRIYQARNLWKLTDTSPQPL